jgi:hypothetical protein
MRRASTLAGTATLAGAFALAALEACSLDLTGALFDDGGAGDATIDGAGPDTAPPPVDATTSDGGADGALDAIADAAPDAAGDSGCAACAASAACETGKCVDVAVLLTALRYEQPCTLPSRPFCGTGASGSKAVALTGTLGNNYDITIHVRGVVEQKTYNGSAAGGATGTNASFFITAGTTNIDGFAVYGMNVSAPAAKVFFNAGTSGHSYSDGIDYHATIRATGGATLTLAGDPVDGAEAPNVDDGGTAIVIPGIPPAPNPFDGQFLQLDVESVRLVP